MGKPTLALALICKNEVHNLPQLLASVRGCFDEIHVTDTGSTDGTLELLEAYTKQNPAETPLIVHHFEWVKDFAAARNYSFSHVKTDYIAWLDCDDVLEGREEFIAWRNEVMILAEYWLATYVYGSDGTGRPRCQFARERVIRNGLGMAWRYFVHEGIAPIAQARPVQLQYATTWKVVHKRTEEDLKADRSRNLSLFEGRGKLDARMTYYYGKELFENQKPLEAFTKLMEAVAEPDLEAHDRVMAIQYACLSAMQCGQYDRAVALSHQGLQLTPGRAEFFVFIADSYLKLNRMPDSMPYYGAAMRCLKAPDNAAIQGPIYQEPMAYEYYPRHQLAKIAVQLGQLDMATKLLEDAASLGPNVETMQLMVEVEKVKEQRAIAVNPTKCDDIVITCAVNDLYLWDEDVLKERGIGGSETAAVHMARHLHQKTGRKIIVFNNREKAKEIDGVHYLPIADHVAYFKQFEPRVHVAWRHNTKLTNAPTYVWCHDLVAGEVEHYERYERVLALSPFHKNFLANFARIPREKIHVTRNGLDPSLFENLPTPPRLNRVVFGSSPDRGLDRAIAVMDRVVQAVPDAELHVFYGFDNMLKMGRQTEVEKYLELQKGRPWLKLRGNVPQKQLIREEYVQAKVWLYPANFLETFCITALEMICTGVQPIVRKWGALPDTLEGFHGVIDSDCVTDQEIDLYAYEVIAQLRHNKAHCPIPPTDYAWSGVADEWITLLGLERLN